MKIIGFNSGVLHHTFHPISKEMLDIIRNTGANAVELGSDQAEQLKDLEVSDFQGFSYISIHAPSNVIYGQNQEAVKVLDSIQEAHERFSFKCVVIHPDRVDNWDIFDNYNFPIAVENMDFRKNFGKTVKDVKQVLENNDYGFVLDLNHCYSNDKSLRLAWDFYKAFKNRLCEIHISGFQKYHEPLFKTRQNKIIKMLPKKEVPIIIESVCDDMKEIKKELEYVNLFFDKIIKIS
ncbi:MAG: hypothetical protein NT136_00360 [Candidatus Moranbacteria bacterium]|nr:hypothetical protein [Candidatus Moranbacteria bacterium]